MWKAPGDPVAGSRFEERGPRAPRAGPALALAALLLGTACGAENIPEPDASLEPRLAPGTARVEYAGGRVSVFSNRAWNLSILERLAERVGFELVVGAIAPHEVELRLVDVPLAEAIPRLLGNRSYAVDYGFDAERQDYVLVRLRVGDPLEESAARSRKRPRKPKSPDELAERRGRKRRTEERLRAIELRREREADPEHARRTSAAIAAQALEERRRQARLLAQLDDPAPEVRVEAASGLDLDGDSRASVIFLLAADPDSRVRGAAAKRLAEEDSHAAIRGLVEALSDPAREVVLEAVKALAASGDDSVIPELMPLMEHADPEVRSATGEAIEELE